MSDFKEKQIEKLQAAIERLETKSGDAQRAARAGLEARIDAACAKAAAKYKGQIEVLEKQLKALGGSR